MPKKRKGWPVWAFVVVGLVAAIPLGIGATFWYAVGGRSYLERLTGLELP